VTRWRFQFAPSATGTTLTESFDAPMINVAGAASNFDGRFEMLDKAIRRRSPTSKPPPNPEPGCQRSKGMRVMPLLSTHTADPASIIVRIGKPTGIGAWRTPCVTTS